VGKEVGQILVEDLRSQTGRWLDLGPLLGHHLGNFMNQLVFGIQYEQDSAMWRYLQHLRDEGIKLMGVCGPVNFLPWLRFWPPIAAGIRWIKAGQARTHEEYERIVQLMEARLEGGEVAGNITQLFLQEMRRRRGQQGAGSFTREQLYYLQVWLAARWSIYLRIYICAIVHCIVPLSLCFPHPEFFQLPSSDSDPPFTRFHLPLTPSLPSQTPSHLILFPISYFFLIFLYVFPPTSTSFPSFNPFHLLFFPPLKNIKIILEKWRHVVIIKVTKGV
jgi:hypothetical protein